MDFSIVLICAQQIIASDTVISLIFKDSILYIIDRVAELC